MAVKIRLTRLGKKDQPVYRVVAVDSRKKRDGAYIEKIGYYNPSIEPPEIKIDKDKLNYWLSRGAQMTEAVMKLVKG